MGKKLDIAVALKIGADVSASVAKSFGETKSHLDKLTRAAALAAKEQAAAEAKYDKARQQKRSLESARTTSRRLIGERENAISDVASIEAKRNAVRVDVKKYGSKDDIKRLRSLDRAFDRATRKVDTATTALDKHRQKLAEAGKESFALAGKTRELEKEVDKLGNAAAKADKKLVSAEGWNKLKSGALAFTGVAIGAVAAVGSVAAATVTALWKIDKGVAERAKSIETSAAGLGISTDVYQGMTDLASDQAGWKEEKTKVALAKALSNTEKAVRYGDKGMSRSLRNLGIHIGDLDRKGPENAIRVLLNAAQKNKDNKGASVDFEKIFGQKLGVDWAKIGEGGAVSLDETVEKRTTEGSNINKSVIEKAKRFREALDAVEEKFQSIENIFAGATFDSFTKALNAAADTITQHTPEIKKFADDLGAAIEDFVNSGRLESALKLMGGVFKDGLALVKEITGSKPSANKSDDGSGDLGTIKKAGAAVAVGAGVRFAVKHPYLSGAEVLAAQGVGAYNDAVDVKDWISKNVQEIKKKGMLDWLKNTTNDGRLYFGSMINSMRGKPNTPEQESYWQKSIQEAIDQANKRSKQPQTVNITNHVTVNAATTADPNSIGQAVAVNTAETNRRTLNDLHYA